MESIQGDAALTGVSVNETPEIMEQTLEVCSVLAPVEGPAQVPPANVGLPPNPYRLYRKRILPRSIGLLCKRLYLAAHCVSLRHSEDFSEAGPVVDLDRTADCVLTTHWATDENGLPRIALCFRYYRPGYDDTNNIVTFGAANIYAKDGNLAPEPRPLRGQVFNGERRRMPPKLDRNTFNYRQFIELDGELEAVVRVPELLDQGPALGQCMLGFEMGLFQEKFKSGRLPTDEAVLANLKVDAIKLLQPEAHAPLWLSSPGGTIVEIQNDPDTSEVFVVFDTGAIIEVPPMARLAARTQVGATVDRDVPIAFLSAMSTVKTWDDAKKSFARPGDDDDSINAKSAILLTQILEASWYDIDGLRCAPNHYIPADMVGKHSRVLRDIRGCSGRVLHNPRNPGEFTVRERSSQITKWNLGGFPGASNLCLSGPGWKANFHHLREDWQKFFEPGRPDVVSPDFKQVEQPD